MVYIEVLEVVVEVDAARTEIAAEKCRVRREHCGNIDVTFPAEGDRKAGLPLVEVRDDSGMQLPRDILQPLLDPQSHSHDELQLTSPRNHATRYPKTIVSFVS